MELFDLFSSPVDDVYPVASVLLSEEEAFESVPVVCWLLVAGWAAAPESDEALLL